MNFRNTNPAIVWLLALAGMLSLALPVHAAEAVSAPDVKGGFEPVAPFVDENTFLVARVDLRRTDPAAIEAWIDDLAKNAHGDPDAAKDFAQDMAGARQAIGGWMTAFTKAGGRQLYLVMNLLDLPNPAIVVTVADGADIQAIKELFAPTPPGGGAGHSYGVAPKGPRAEQIGQVVVVAPEATLRRFHESKPADRPDLSTALATAGDATIAVALAPPPDTRRVVEESMPALPPELGGGPAIALTRGLRWISLGIHLPPDPSIHLIIRAQDVESAKALAGVVETAFKSLARATEQEAGLSGLGKLAADLTPALSPDHPDELTLSLDKSAIQKLVAAELPDQLMRARAQAKAIRSMNNIRQLILGCLQYADAHKGDWPDDLEKAVKADDIGLDVLVNPVNPGSKPGYTYLNPRKAADIKDYSGRLVIYETEGGPTGRRVGFADGHVQVVKEPEFQKYLKEAKEAAAKGRKQE